MGREAQHLFGPAMVDHARALLSEDLAVYEAGSRGFLAGCAARPIPEGVAEAALAEMQRVPAVVRRAAVMERGLLPRDRSYTGSGNREQDAVVSSGMSDQIEALRPGVSRVRFLGVGHLPWLEAPDTFREALYALFRPEISAPNVHH